MPWSDIDLVASLPLSSKNPYQDNPDTFMQNIQTLLDKQTDLVCETKYLSKAPIPIIKITST